MRTGPRRRGLAACALVLAAGCLDRLPEQDRRILSAVPVAKMPVEDLAADYRLDRSAADRKYFGKAIEISGRVADVRDQTTGVSLTFTDKAGVVVVDATLLEDQAKDIVASLGEARRVRLKCFCDKAASPVTLRSCAKP